MKRTQIYLTEQEVIKLKEKSQDLGISKSELIRRIIDLYLDKENINGQRQ